MTLFDQGSCIFHRGRGRHTNVFGQELLQLGHPLPKGGDFPPETGQRLPVPVDHELVQRLEGDLSRLALGQPTLLNLPVEGGA